MIDPSYVDVESLQNDINLMDEDAEKMAEAERAELQRQQAEEEVQEKETQEKEELGYSGTDGLKRYTNMLGSAGKSIKGAFDNRFDYDPIYQGIAKGLNGLFTMPERTYDLATGEIERQEQDGGEYAPDFNPFIEAAELPEDANWWQEGTRNLTSAVIEAAPAVVATGGAGLPVRFFAGTALDTLASGDVGTRKAQNLTNQIIQTFPWAEPALRNLAIDQDDSPQVKTIKALLENMVFEGAGELIGFLVGPGRRAADEVDIEDQMSESAYITRMDDIRVEDAQYRTGDQLDGQRSLPEGTEKVEATNSTDQVSQPPQSSGRWRAPKNPDTAGPGQNGFNSRSTTQQQYQNRTKQLKEGDEMGTAGYTMPDAQRERMYRQNGIDPEWMEGVAKKLYGENYYEQLMKMTAKARKSWYEANKEIYSEYQTMMGRFDASMDAEEFYKTFIDRSDSIDSERVFRTVDGVVTDLINAEMFQGLRNQGMAALELAENFDIMDTDGPMYKAAQYLTFGLANVRRSRWLKSFDFKLWGIKNGLDEGTLEFATKKAEFIKTKSAEFQKESSETVEAFMQYVKQQPSDEAAKVAAELFAKADVNNVADLGAYLESNFKRGEFGKYGKGTPQLANEFNTLLSLSQLSSPKTIFKTGKGTLEVYVENSVGHMLGAMIQGDLKGVRKAASGIRVLGELGPDFMRILNKNLNAWWNKDMASLGNRYAPKINPDQDAKFDMFYEYTMKNGGLGEKVYASTLASIRAATRWQAMSYPFALMSSIDEFAGVAIVHMRAKYRAMDEVLDGKKWNSPINKDDFKEAKEIYLGSMMDKNGDIDFDQDIFAKARYQEVTQTKPLEGILGGVDKLVDQYPKLGIFYRYMTTGVNSIMFNVKKFPILGLAHKEYTDMFRTMRDGNFARTQKYGIDNAEDLKAAMQIWHGRQAIGALVVGYALERKFNNQLNGNGPANPSMRRAWERAGWKARTVYIGGAGVSLEGFDTFNLLFYTVSDIIDNSRLMGDKYADTSLAQLVFAVGIGLTSKSMLSGVNDLLRTLQGEEGSFQRLLANTVNSAAPWSGLRNLLGKTMKPQLLELNKNIGDDIRNRNRFFEPLASDPLPESQKDVLYGDDLSPWDYVLNAVNMVSPIALDFKATDRPGRDLLLASGYNVQLITSNHAGISLIDSPKVRALFATALSEEGLGKELDALAVDPVVIQSMDRMEQDRQNSEITGNPFNKYQHLRLIRQRINAAKSRAWDKIANHPDVRALLDADKQQTIEERETLRDTSSQAEALINWGNK